jgi:transcription elongation factor GreA
MSKVSYYTPEGLKKLRAELKQLKDVERVKASRAIAEARDKGDLSENAEYDSAKDEQALLEIRISELENKLATAKLLDESTIDTTKVSLLSNVTIKNKANGMEVTYSIVPADEADLKKNKISVQTPIAKGLLGKKEGDVAEIVLPMGKSEFEIIKITR